MWARPDNRYTTRSTAIVLTSSRGRLSLVPRPFPCKWKGLRTRLRRTEQSPVAEHFNGEGHTLADLTVMMIDQLYSHDPCLCKIRESRWIRTLGTLHPFGLNLRVDSLWNLRDDYLRTPWNSARLLPRLLAIPRRNNYVLAVTRSRTGWSFSSQLHSYAQEYTKTLW